jgi:hypothetical protein
MNEFFPEPTLSFVQYIIEPNIITVEPHVVTGSMIAGYFIVEEIFFILFWDMLKPTRDKILILVKLKKVRDWIKRL